MNEIEDGPQWPGYINPSQPPKDRVVLFALQVEAIQPGEEEGTYGIVFVEDGYGIEHWDTFQDGPLPEVGEYLGIQGQRRFPLPVSPSDLGLVRSS